MSRPVVLVYHRVAELDADPLGMAVGPVTFEAHLDVLAATAAVVPLREIRHAGADAVAITFDDGYADNLEVAAPALERRGFPATFFVASDALDGRGFWWDRLEHLLGQRAGPGGAEALVVDACRLRVDVRSPAARQRAHRALTRRLRQLPPGVIEDALVDIASQLHRAEPTVAEPTLDPAGVRALAASGGFEVGAHTRSHALLAALGPAEQRHQIADGRRRLEDAAGTTVDLFAYPYGMAGSFTQTTQAIVAELGFALACSNIVGSVPRRGSRWSIPRCAVGDWEPEVFAHKLAEWRMA